MKRTGDQRLYKGTLPLTHHHSFEFLRLCQGCLDPLSLFNMIRRLQPPYIQPGETGNQRGGYVMSPLRLGEGLAFPHPVYHELLPGLKKKPD